MMYSLTKTETKRANYESWTETKDKKPSCR